ncbi:unnamed protein product [Phytomonas sp. EM1]|nr:unnamed protein product [Phytomonas sp. EM1]|eukprot:CCW64519.1 unnamed protein product [Phytomonas sp. isolate EM1]
MYLHAVQWCGSDSATQYHGQKRLLRQQIEVLAWDSYEDVLFKTHSLGQRATIVTKVNVFDTREYICRITR